MKSRTVLKAILIHTKVSYFYITLNWEEKKSTAVRWRERNGIAAFGSSETVFGWHAPYVQSLHPGKAVYNFGLLASTVRQQKALIELLAGRSPDFESVYISMNPMMVASLFDQVTRGADYSGTLQLNYLERIFPLAVWLRDLIPSYRYRSIYYDVLKRTAFSTPSGIAKVRAANIETFLAMDQRENLGFIPAPNTDRAVKSTLEKNCLQMTQWNFENSTLPDEMLTLWGEILDGLSRISRRVTVFRAPATREWSAYVPEDYYNQMKEAVHGRGLEYISASTDELNASENFMDCVHLNSTGAAALTRFLLESSVNKRTGIR